MSLLFFHQLSDGGVRGSSVASVYQSLKSLKLATFILQMINLRPRETK
jgi:hypothetical protein